MITLEVRPENKSREVLAVSLVSLAIILIAAALIFLRKIDNDQPGSLRSHQRDASEVLNGVEWQKYSDLYTEGVGEIINTFQEQVSSRGTWSWPTIRELEQKMVPPFEQISLQSSEGKYTWRQRSQETKYHIRGIYQGRSETPEEYGSFIVLIEFYITMEGVLSVPPESDNPYSIWYKDGKFTLPAEVSEGTLINDGWNELVNITGTMQ
jgi:hypothetical protein